MTDKEQACSDDLCDPSTKTTNNISRNADYQSITNTLSIEIVSDIICPWCYIGKRRIERALEQVDFANRIEIIWRPFQLNPTMPKEGVNRRQYRTQKFGTWEYSLSLDAQVTSAARELGLPFNFALVEKTPNTFDGHRLLWFADKHGNQSELAETLFKAYFCDGLDIGNSAVLVKLAGKSGLDERASRVFLESSEGIAEVSQEEEKARTLGVNSVPSFFANGELLFSGAQAPEDIRLILENAKKELLAKS
jgi:predicted DsbA family dithiol-disulfide isomerase